MGITAASRSRAVSELLGVVVLIGMTLLVTVALGAGVMLISQQEADQTADIGFTHLGDRLVINYNDGTDRPAGRLYVDGPENNVSWAELSDNLGPEGMVEQGAFLEVGPETAYGSGVSEEATFDIVYFTGSGERFVLATWNEVDEEADTPTGPDGPGGPDGPDGPGGPEEPESP
ncbi:MAG: archaellin/type IV pilin N-terminal domain-containing protein [Halovenus sp.]